ncbi:MAG: hypothetical protein FWG00_01270 [Coriobacteriia bacterium]|nr:hypothetical protein [Coriobacteriia bacterium]
MDTRISENLARSSRVLDIIGKVLAIICIVSAVFTLFGAIAILAIPNDLIINLLNQIPITPVTSDVISIPAGTVLGDYITLSTGSALKVALIVAAGALCVYCLLSAGLLFVVSGVFKATAVNKTPFVAENVKRLKIIGIIMIVASLVLGLTNLVFAFCVFALAYVVQYGVELQQQADETL